MLNNRFTGLHKIIVYVLFLTAALVSVATAGQETKLTGRVLAVSVWPVAGSKQSQEFIFGIDSKDSQGNEMVLPVFIRHSYPAHEGFLPEDFFDYSKKYELSVIEENIDISFENVAYVNFVGNNGALGSFAGMDSPWPRLKILDGVPENILKMNDNKMLPFYELVTIKYKTINEN